MLEGVEKITPLDIEEKEFSRSFRGYNIDEVDDFLDRVAKNYELLSKENHILRRQLEEIKGKLEEYKRDEEMFRKTLVTAQKRSEEIEREAERKRDLILREAELEAEKIIQSAKLKAEEILREANAKVVEIKNELVTLEKERDVFIMKLRTVVESFIEILDSLKKESIRISESSLGEDEQAI